ncbi:FxSxx-COOH system tetratricopeptide repeat protein [Streptomyces sp. NBC_01803]|uniref:FxSxx-COOH system tetratricopeptide repeat protein n=1 Tax=Streptomyces sp. NBC_01803 TaxID=2975946 RepID=UPI002DD957C7|nr:FxSxx-COOH system tetratricopeptide repeat protein [Streptomyces sp. NBC_01803]WSA43644.1 FxSxx-COOH system tetratricopeptide repeat protein [Streptomyces sp. NBC_01803]
MDDPGKAADQPPPVEVRNVLRGGVNGPVVQAGAIHGDVFIRSGPPPASQVEASAGSSRLPRRPVDVLWGRDQVLAEISRLLDTVDGNTLGAAVVGLAGMGKTELALHAVHRSARRTIWWVSAEKPDAVLRGLASLAYRLRPEIREWNSVTDAADWAMEWLHSHDDWLLVLDNVEDRESVAEIVARCGKGPVLVTSRWDLNWDRIGLATIPLPVLARSDSVRFLLAETGLDDADAAERLAQRIGDLPLMLDQACAHIREQDLSFDEYTDLLASQPQTLLGSAAWSDIHRSSVARTFRLSLDAVSSRRPSAAELLGVICCFSPDSVPRRFLRTQAEESVELREDIGILRAYSLITANRDEVGVHRLLWEYVRAALTVEPRVTAATYLRRALPSQDLADIPNWARWAELADHVDALDPLIAEAGIPQASLDLANCAHRVGEFQLSQGWLKGSRRLLSRAVEERTRWLGPDAPDTLAARHRLGEAVRGAGDLDEALAMHSAVLRTREQTLGSDHQQTLQTREAQAITKNAMGRLDDAIVEHQAIYRARVAALGQDHPDTIWSLHNLAITYKNNDQFDSAIALHELVRAKRTAIFGADHPDTLRSLHNIANTYHHAGRYAEAIEAQERSVTERIHHVGPHHRDTLRSQSNLADHYLAAGRVEDAITLHRSTLRQRETGLGADEPDTVWSRGQLAKALAARDSPAPRTPQGQRPI